MFIGRPVLWGLAHGGEEGVYNVVNLLKEEFNLAMALAGCVKIEVKIQSLPHSEAFSHI